MARLFKTLGRITHHTHIFAPIREIVNGPRGPEFRNRDIANAIIKSTSTVVTDTQANLLRESPEYGKTFVEVTDAKAKGRAAAAKLAGKTKAPEPEVSAEADESVEPPEEVEEVTGVVDLNEAFAYLLQRGVAEGDMKDKNGRLNHNKVKARAAALNVTFPNLW